MTGHWDAALFGVILFTAYLILLGVYRHVMRRRIARVRVQRDRHRDAYDQLLGRYKATIARFGVPFDRHADEALAVDEPVPYQPVWTTGALDEVVDTEFDRLMHHGFIADGGAAS